jgi:hypothetical protein
MSFQRLNTFMKTLGLLILSASLATACNDQSSKSEATSAIHAEVSPETKAAWQTFLQAYATLNNAHEQRIVDFSQRMNALESADPTEAQKAYLALAQQNIDDLQALAADIPETKKVKQALLKTATTQFKFYSQPMDKMNADKQFKQQIADATNEHKLYMLAHAVNAKMTDSEEAQQFLTYRDTLVDLFQFNLRLAKLDHQFQHKIAKVYKPNQAVEQTEEAMKASEAKIRQLAQQFEKNISNIKTKSDITQSLKPLLLSVFQLQAELSALPMDASEETKAALFNKFEAANQEYSALMDAANLLTTTFNQMPQPTPPAAP